MIEDSLAEVQEYLGRKTEETSVVVMPDFFLDRVVSLRSDVKSFCEDLESVARRKGGSIDGVNQSDLRGGNAVNTASALATLGANVTPIVCASKLGQKLLRYHLRSNRVDLTHVRVSSRASVTTAIEFAAGDEKANVMLRDVGSLVEFGPEGFNDRDWRAVEEADYVCVFNWAGTRQSGTELAKTVFSRVKGKGRGRTYYDTADPIPNEAGIPRLVREVLLGRHLDVLSVNENEAMCFAAQLGDRLKEKKGDLHAEDLAAKAAGALSSRLHARVDLHATSFSATFTKKGKSTAPVFDIPVLRATGAGDAWNAGSILGEAGGLSDEGRLILANATAAYYISSPAGLHPTRSQLARFCRKTRLKKQA